MFCPVFVVPLSDDLKRRGTRAFRKPLHHLNRSLDCAALEAEKDVRQVARQFEAIEGSLATFLKQGEEYLQWLAVALFEEFGEPEELRKAALLRRLSRTKKRQARMTTEPESDRRTA